MISERSLKNLEGLHPDLRAVLRMVLEEDADLVLIEGLRTAQRQRELIEQGASWTMNSRHLTGHAGDLAIVRNGEFIKDFAEYAKIAPRIKAAAKRLGIPVTWGGDWKTRDGLHWQLSWDAYPLSENPKRASNSKTIAAATAGVPLAALVPELMKAVEGFSEALKGIAEEWASTAQLVLMMAVAGFIIWERLRKLEEDGL